MKVLITGGAGYIGTSVTPLLLKKGYHVKAIDNLSFGGEALIPFFSFPNYSFQKGDIRDVSSMKQALDGIDCIIHLAGIVGYPACRKYPKESREINLDANRLLLELASKEQLILYASTGSTYGELIGELCTETTPLNPLTDYGKQKMEAEEMIMNRGNAVSFRFATAYGVSPRLRLDLLINDFTFKAVKDKTLIVYEKHFMRTFIHVRDMARSFLFTLEHFDTMNDEVYNVGDNAQNFSKEQICFMIREKIEYYLHFAEIGKDLDQRNYMVSYKKISDLGFQCNTSVSEGIDELLKVADVVEIKSPFSNV